MHRSSSASAGGGAGALVRGGLEGVVERLQLGARAVTALQGQRDQVVGEPGVLRQQRPVQIGAEDVVAEDSLECVLAVVAEPFEEAAGRMHTGAQGGGA